jgi:Cof subfamily protein (haloacid dehalogenase superfamily)
VNRTKLVAVDVDGTLVDESLEISRADVAAIARALEAGIGICLATGRLFSAAKPFADALGLGGYLIPLNGAAIYRIGDATMVHSVPLAAAVALDALDALREDGFRVQLYFGDRLYLDGMDERAAAYLRLSRVEPIMVDDLRALLTTEMPAAEGPMKVLGIADDRRVVEVAAKLAARFAGRANVFRSLRHYLEVTDPNANKGTALAWVAQRMGIPRSALAAIGDSDNDVTMFKVAGRSFAVANATPAARQNASVVVGPQGKGVADALGQLLEAAVVER